MRTAVATLGGGAGSSHAARRLLLAYLVCALVSRLADANPHPDLFYAPCVAACFVLPAWYALGWSPGAWQRAPLVLLTVQAVVTFVPLLAFGQHWVGGVDGLLGGLVLAVLPRRVSWSVFAALWVAELAIWLAVGVPFQPGYDATFWLMNAYTTTALGYFGLYNASRLLDRLESTAEMLADAAVDRQRLATAEGLQATILRRLDDIQQHATEALAADAATTTSKELRQVGNAARDAAASARRIVSAIPQPATTGVDDAAVTPSFAQRIVLTVALFYALQFVMNTVAPVVATPLTDLIAITIAALMVLIQVHHSRLRQGGRPRTWAWTLIAQLVLCLVLFPIFGAGSLVLIAFVSGSILLLMTHPVRWVLASATVASIPVFTLLGLTELPPDLRVQWAIYAAATTASATVIIYGLGRFVRAAAALADARRLLAEAAITRERVRIARDTHDTLGLALSAIALKSDLAEALLARDPARARREIVQTIHLSRTVAADADSIVHGNLRLHLDVELDSARSALDSAGITVTTTRDRVVLSPEAETEIAAVLREAVANVLRHSDARTCTIRITASENSLDLEVTNDGARESAGSGAVGRGLENIRDRAAALGGAATVAIHGDTFTLSARLPRAEQAVTQ